jgi:chromosome segregation ATPase
MKKGLGKLAFASIKVFRKDLEEVLKECAEDIGVAAREEEDVSFESELEKQREKVISRVNKYFDRLKEEMHEERQGEQQRDKDLSELSLSVRELRQQLESLKEDIGELKGRS